MGKFSPPSVIPGAQPELPTQNKASDFAELLEQQAPEQTSPAAPESTGAAIPTQPIAEVPTGAQIAANIAPEERMSAEELFESSMPTVQVDATGERAAVLNEEQRARERIPAYSEVLGRPLNVSSVDSNQPVESMLRRGDNVAATLASNVAGSKMTGAARVEQIQAGFPEAAFAQTDAEGNVQTPVAPALKNSNVNVGVQAMIYDPRLLGASVLDPETNQLTVDPDLGKLMSIATEAWLYQQMEAATERSGAIDEETGVPGELEFGETGGQRFTKATGNERLGREIWAAYKRQQAVNKGDMSDSYLDGIDDVSSEMFVFLGDLAKETYAKANPDMLFRDDREVQRGVRGGQVYFQLTPEGAMKLDALQQSYKGLMAQAEVKPLNGVSETAQPVFEGRMRVRPVTTKIGDLKDWSIVQEAMANYHGVKYVNDPGRERIAYMFAMLGLINANNPDNQVYSGMFDLGAAALQALQGEKQRLLADAQNETIPPLREKKMKLAQAYDPIKILQANREKFLNVSATAGEYSGMANHLTFSMQSLTGRTHVQQTLYNPQAHKFLRFIVGSGQIYRWRPGSNTEVEKAWKEIISAAMYTSERNGQTFKGSELSTTERLANFESNLGGAQWNQMVAWGNQLKNATLNFDVDGAKGVLGELKRAKSPEEVSTLKRRIMETFGQDPLDASLKADLAKHGNEAPHMAEFYIQIADYDAAMKAGKSFASTINAEMDGKTHGPATNAAQLGVPSMAKRTGLIVTQDFSNTDLMDSRKAMGEQMNDTITARAGGLYPANQMGIFQDIVALATKDRDNFLKKSPMTMGYGQEIPSLKGHVETTVFVGPQSEGIKKLAQDNNIDLQDVVNVLHTMLVDSIFEIMDPKVVAAGRLLRANALLSQITNEVMYFENAMGFRSYAAGKQTVPEETRSVPFKFRDGQQVSVQFYKERAEGSAVRGERGPGAWTSGRIIPVAVQSYDGNMISRTGSGSSWAAIQAAAKRNGSDNAFMLPIFDAAVTDLGTFTEVRKQMNANWLAGIRDHSYVDSIMDGWFNETMQNFEQRMMQNPNEVFDIADPDSPFRGLNFLWAPAGKKDTQLSKAYSKVLQAPAKTPGVDIKTYINTLKDLGRSRADEVFNMLNEEGINPMANSKLTAAQIVKAVKIISNGMNLSSRNKQAVNLIKKDKAELLQQVDKTVTQVDL